MLGKLREEGATFPASEDREAFLQVFVSFWVHGSCLLEAHLDVPKHHNPNTSKPKSPPIPTGIRKSSQMPLSPHFPPHVGSWRRRGINQWWNGSWEVSRWAQSEFENSGGLEHSLTAWAGDWLSGLWESVWPFYFDPICQDQCREQSLFANWKPLDFPPTLKTPVRHSKGGKLTGQESKNKASCSAFPKCAGQPANWLTGDLAGGRRWAWRTWGMNDHLLRDVPAVPHSEAEGVALHLIYNW